MDICIKISVGMKWKYIQTSKWLIFLIKYWKNGSPKAGDPMGIVSPPLSFKKYLRLYPKNENFWP